jgi:hypothetical protein
VTYIKCTHIYDLIKPTDEHPHPSMSDGSEVPSSPVECEKDPHGATSTPKSEDEEESIRQRHGVTGGKFFKVRFIEKLRNLEGSKRNWRKE